MEIGKVPNTVLQKLILDKLKPIRKEVLIRPGIGEDCCAIDFEDYACVLSSDPITGTENEIGRLSVHISCNDIAACGVEPLGLLVTLLAPPTAKEQDLELIMKQISETAALLNVEIIGGHTEVTSAVNRFVISTTAIGKAPKHKLVATRGAKPGDSIIMTKYAALEGTAIIAYEKEDELKEILSREQLARAKEFMNHISVVKEGVIAGEFGASAMHDVTEGGILGAVWEIAEASNVGVEVDCDKIPVEPETSLIVDFYSIDPLKLISSGCMAITAQDGEGLVKKLEDSGVKATIIGRVNDNGRRVFTRNGIDTELKQPEADELYKVV